MNADRRKRVAKIAEQLRAILSDLEQVAGEEADAFGNMPAGLQESERGQKASECADLLNDAASELTDICDKLEGMES